LSDVHSVSFQSLFGKSRCAQSSPSPVAPVDGEVPFQCSKPNGAPLLHTNVPSVVRSL